jgi:hypothetical protein
MRLLISGLAGVGVACLVFSALVLSRSNLEMMLGSPRTDLPLSPINVRLTISGFTEPRGIGSQALLTINVTSSVEAANVTFEINLSKAYPDWPSQGIELICSNTTWKGNLLATISVVMNAWVNVTQIGYGKIVAAVVWYDPSSNWEHYSRDQLGIVVLEEEILVIEDLGGNLPHLFPPGSNPTPPWPSPPPENFTWP